MGDVSAPVLATGETPEGATSPTAVGWHLVLAGLAVCCAVGSWTTWYTLTDTSHLLQFALGYSVQGIDHGRGLGWNTFALSVGTLGALGMAALGRSKNALVVAWALLLATVLLATSATLDTITEFGTTVSVATGWGLLLIVSASGAGVIVGAIALVPRAGAQAAWEGAGGAPPTAPHASAATLEPATSDLSPATTATPAATTPGVAPAVPLDSPPSDGTFEEGPSFAGPGLGRALGWLLAVLLASCAAGCWFRWFVYTEGLASVAEKGIDQGHGLGWTLFTTAIAALVATLAALFTRAHAARLVAVTLAVATALLPCVLMPWSFLAQGPNSPGWGLWLCLASGVAGLPVAFGWLRAERSSDGAAVRFGG